MTDAEALRILFPDLSPLPHDEHCGCALCWRSLCPCCWQDVAWSIEILRDPRGEALPGRAACYLTRSTLSR
jgi:hypothetical protein